jgi:hypothetical protein
MGSTLSGAAARPPHPACEAGGRGDQVIELSRIGARLSLACLLMLGLPTVASTCSPASAPDGCSLPPAPSQANPSPGGGDDYWTPERMRDAKPMEKRPEGAVDEPGPVPPCSPESITAPGSPGTRDSGAPDDSEPGRE